MFKISRLVNSFGYSDGLRDWMAEARFPAGARNYSLLYIVQSALRPTQPPLQWVPRLLHQKLNGRPLRWPATHAHLVTRLTMSGNFFFIVILRGCQLDYIASNGSMIDKIWIRKDFEEIGHVLIEVLTQHLPGGAEENHAKDSQYPGQDSNRATLEYNSFMCATLSPFHTST
jgi:hypothetical protein